MIFAYKKQQGFSILAVILLIIAIVVSMGAWLLSGTVNTNVVNNNKFEVEASAIMDDANAIKNVYTRLTYSGADSSQITFVPNQAASPTTFNILDPQRGIKQPTIGLLNIHRQLEESESLWVFNNSTFSGFNVGTQTADPVILLAGLSDETCTIINTKLYGVTTIPKLSGFTTGASWVTGATKDNPTSNKSINLGNIITTPQPNGWTTGCIAPASLKHNNLFFYILKSN